MPIHIGDARESQLRRDEAAEMSSMPYRAPELFTCEIDSDVTVAVDIWVSTVPPPLQLIDYSHSLVSSTPSVILFLRSIQSTRRAIR